MIGSSDPDDESVRDLAETGLHQVDRRQFGAGQAYGAGIPDNGKPVPDGAAFAKIEWQKARETVPYAVTLTGKLAEVSFMLKD